MVDKRWESEYHFVTSVITQIYHTLFASDTEKLTIMREFHVGNTIADIIISKAKLKKYKIPTDLTVKDAVILSTLRNGKSSRIDILEKKCGLPLNDLRSGQLDKLYKVDIIKMGKGGQISLSHKWVNLFEIYAIEAKLKDWRRALKQATAYCKYADKAFVLLPEKYSKPAIKAQEFFEEKGIGLLVGEKGKVSCVFKAKTQKKHDWRREFVCSRLIQSNSS